MSSAAKIPVVSIVAALSPGFGIGFQGSLPWRLSKEMKYFREVTSLTHDANKRNAVVMGRKTWESIPAKFRPLPNRINVVISRSFELPLEKDSETNYYKGNSIHATINELKSRLGDQLERIYIIGGAEIYNNSFDIIDNCLITKLTPITNEQTVIPEMDTFLDEVKLQETLKDTSNDLPRFLPSGVHLPECTPGSRFVDQEKGYEFEYLLYAKKL